MYVCINKFGNYSNDIHILLCSSCGLLKNLMCQKVLGNCLLYLLLEFSRFSGWTASGRPPTSFPTSQTLCK
jgi:hypothetical protein